MSFNLDSSIVSTNLSAWYKTFGESQYMTGSLESCRDLLPVHVLMPISNVLCLSLPLYACAVCVSVCFPAFPHSQDEESVPVEFRNLPEYKELLELKRLKKQKLQKLQEIQEDKVGVRHAGYKVKTMHVSLNHRDNIKARFLYVHVSWNVWGVKKSHPEWVGL